MARPRLKPPTAPRRIDPRRAARGGAGRRAGRKGEWIAALLLMAKGYRILGFRLQGPGGEIDILARKGRVLAVVEVKRRATIEAALCAVTAEQKARLMRSALALAARRPALKGLDIRLDMVALASGRFPRHVRNLVQNDATRG